MNGFGRYLPFGVAAVAVVYFFCAMQPPTDPPGGFHLHDFAMLPVEGEGRVKPLDSAARNDLMILSEGHQTFRDEKGDEQPAVRWLLDVLSDRMVKDGPAEKDKIFRIDNDQILKMLDLPARPGSYRYGLEEFAPHLGEFGYDLPEGWIQLPVPETGMVRPLAVYGVGDGGAQVAKATVNMFSGDSGGVLENVNRWRGQVGLAPIKEDQLGDAALSVGGTLSPYVDLTGTTKDGPTRLLGVIVPHGGATWFFKFMGPLDLVAKEKALLRRVRDLAPTCLREGPNRHRARRRGPAPRPEGPRPLRRQDDRAERTPPHLRRTAGVGHAVGPSRNAWRRLEDARQGV